MLQGKSSKNACEWMNEVSLYGLRVSLIETEHGAHR